MRHKEGNDGLKVQKQNKKDNYKRKQELNHQKWIFTDSLCFYATFQTFYEFGSWILDDRNTLSASYDWELKTQGAHSPTIQQFLKKTKQNSWSKI